MGEVIPIGGVRKTVKLTAIEVLNNVQAIEKMCKLQYGNFKHTIGLTLFYTDFKNLYRAVLLGRQNLDREFLEFEGDRPKSVDGQVVMRPGKTAEEHHKEALAFDETEYEIKAYMLNWSDFEKFTVPQEEGKLPEADPIFLSAIQKFIQVEEEE